MLLFTSIQYVNIVIALLIANSQILSKEKKIQVHPLFTGTEGEIEDWEVI